MTSATTRAASILRGGRLEILPDCGHLPQVERPERFASALDRFLRDSEA